MNPYNAFKHIPCLAGFLFTLALPAGAQQSIPPDYPTGTPVNFVRVWDAAAPEKDANNLITRPVKDVKTTTNYTDGLGRPLQTVMKQASLVTGAQPTDIVDPHIYDEFGRERFKYLPYAEASSNNGEIKTDPFTSQAGFMNQQYGSQGETWFYSQMNYEPSPLARVEKTMTAGTSWIGSGRGGAFKYWINTTIDDVKIWTVTDVAGSLGTYQATGNYGAGELYKSVTIDEHGKQVIEFKDKEGLLLLKKVQFTATADAGGGAGYPGWLCTYYIYDAFNRLRAVIQPQGVKYLSENLWPSISTSLLNEQCFRYEYDSRNRMIKKKVPGAGEIRMVYDQLDRVVMTQDANMRSLHQWLYNTYDGLSRVVTGGILNDPGNYDNHDYHLSAAYNATIYPNLGSYTYEELTHTFYDDYSWLTGYGSPLPATYNSSYNSYFLPASNSTWPYPQANSQSINLKGLVTGSRTKIIGSSTYLYNVSFYDDKARPIQVQKTNATGGTDVQTIQFNWGGQLLVSILKQEKGGSINPQTHVVVTSITYDDLGRVLNMKKAVSSTVNSVTVTKAEKILVENEYDKLGQLKVKKLGVKQSLDVPVEILNYDYNIRGWLLGANRDYAKDANNTNYFGFDLGYDKANNGIVGNQAYTNPQYNGNIEGMVWKSKGDGEKRKYDFTYDAANRLTGADFNQYTNSSFNKTAAIDFSVGNLSYDANGNIQSMNQAGLKLTSSSLIDQMSYNYYDNSNRLKNVIDAVNDPLTRLGDFRTSVLHPNAGTKDANTIDYTYDDNGNLKKDLNKDIGTSGAEDIVYNYLNLPQSITVRKAGTGNPVKGTINYVYDAAGNKLKKQTIENDVNGKTVTTTTTYIDGIVYESKATVPANTPNDDYTDLLQFIPQEEGRIRFKPIAGLTPASFEYDYFLKDHLGNVRMVLTEEQRQDVYPAATLENATYNGGTAVPVESSYYAIDAGKIKTKSEAHIQTDYANNNGNPPYNNNPYSNTTANSDKVYQLNASSNRTGLGIVLKVMGGDQVNVFGKSYYETPVGGYTTSTNPLSVADILGAFTNNSLIAGKGVTAGQIAATPNFPISILGLLGNQPSQTSSLPKASVNWIILDEQFKYVSGGFDAIGSSGTIKDHNLSTIPTITVPKNGYIYVYCSNESQYNVFFDNLQLIHTRGAILEETHYYPFGLPMASISSKAAGGLENKKKYQQYEWNTDFDLDIYETFYRTYDSQIGRFLQVDPEPNFFESPYISMGNNPVRNVDPYGNSWWDVLAATVISVIDNTVPGSNLRAQYQPTDPSDYNAALKSADLTMLAIGTFMVEDGTRNVGGGAVLVAAGGAGVPLVVTGAAEIALGVDITVNATLNIAKGYNYGTEPNQGVGPKHGSDQHNNRVDEKIEEVRQDPDNSNIRKNQTQHDVDGKKVGNNRPDVQWDNKKKGHHNYEVDTKKKNSEKHKKQIEKNDRNSNNSYEILPPSSFKPMPKG